MKFIAMHKSDAAYEAGEPAPKEAIERLNQFMGEAMQAGVFVSGEGLHPSKESFRLKSKGGVVTTTQGPYQGENELPSSFWILKTKSKNDALQWATRYTKIVGDAELEIGAIVEGWDLGFMPKPEEPIPVRSLLIHKADARIERGETANEATQKRLSALKDEMTRAGVLLSVIDLAPSRNGKRLKFSKGKRVLLDGPFTESKELIAGFSILELSSLEEVIGWSERFARAVDPSLHLEIEIDVRTLA
jgi:hypothetical protein